jgi:hypothetical protein
MQSTDFLKHIAKKRATNARLKRIADLLLVFSFSVAAWYGIIWLVYRVSK